MSRPLTPEQLRAGDSVRDFHVVRRLGVGGFSFVLLVEREGQRYSMKIAARAFSKEDEDQVDAWMRREVGSLEWLEDSHLLPVLEWGRWPDLESGHAYYVTPYVAGSTFHDWRWRERASLHRAMGVLCEALKPLESLHARGVFHRDIKADNLLVREGDDVPFLIDFGAVYVPWARPLTEGLAPGTLYCQPPEAIAFLVSDAARKGERLPARPAADLYAVGVLLYETLTGCRPFNSRLSLEALLVTIAASPPLEPRLLAPGAPASLCALALRLMAKEPGQRPPSARAVREELERLRKEEGQTEAWLAPASWPSVETRARFPGVDVLEPPPDEPAPEEPPRPVAPPVPEAAPAPVPEAAPAPVPEAAPAPVPEAAPAPEAPRPALGWREVVALVALGLGLLGLGWMLSTGLRSEPTAKGPPPVPSFFPSEPSSASTPAPSRLCALLTSVLGVTAQLVGCATMPVRPDPIGYLARCSPEARATPVKLGLTPDENPSYLRSGTPASEQSIEDGGSLNLKPGPVTAVILVEVKGQEVEMKVTGEAVTLPHRVYMQFDRLHLPDGSSLPICGVAVDDLHQYGIATYGKFPIPGSKVDPARVDPSPGSVVLNDPRFETVLVGPEDYPVPRIDLAPPDWR